MKPAPFAYVRARSLDEALAALAEGGDDAKPIAGGQSLVPALNMRLVRPGVLVDIVTVWAVAYVVGDGLEYGCATCSV